MNLPSFSLVFRDFSPLWGLSRPECTHNFAVHDNVSTIWIESSTNLQIHRTIELSGILRLQLFAGNFFLFSFTQLLEFLTLRVKNPKIFKISSRYYFSSRRFYTKMQKLKEWKINWQKFNSQEGKLHYHVSWKDFHPINRSWITFSIVKKNNQTLNITCDAQKVDKIQKRIFIPFSSKIDKHFKCNIFLHLIWFTRTYKFSKIRICG